MGWQKPWAQRSPAAQDMPPPPPKQSGCGMQIPGGRQMALAGQGD
jgi:hypothetical protein